MTTSIPTPVRDAWRGRKLHVGRLTLPPFTLGQYMVLHDIDSPLVNSKRPLTLRGLAEALLVMSQTSAESRALLNVPVAPMWVPGLEKAVEALGAPESPDDVRARILRPEWENAIYAIADGIPVDELETLRDRLAGHINRTFEKAVAMKAQDAGGGGRNFPRPPATPVSGGSSSSSTPSATSTGGKKTKSSTGSRSKSSSRSMPRSARGTA